MVRVVAGGPIDLTRRLGNLMDLSATPVCPACGFRVFNRRYPRCESCGTRLPESIVYSRSERHDLFEADQQLSLAKAREGEPAEEHLPSMDETLLEAVVAITPGE